MNTHIVSFSINYGSGYSDRWRSLIDAIEREAQCRIWKETTSFVLLKSPRTASDLLSTLYSRSLIEQSKGDKLLVIDMTNRSHAQRGVSDPALLASFFPSQHLGLFGNALAARY